MGAEEHQGYQLAAGALLHRNRRTSARAALGQGQTENEASRRRRHSFVNRNLRTTPTSRGELSAQCQETSIAGCCIVRECQKGDIAGRPWRMTHPALQYARLTRGNWGSGDAVLKLQCKPERRQ